MRTPLRTRPGRAVSLGIGVAGLLLAATACGTAWGASAENGIAPAANTGPLATSTSTNLSATDRAQAAAAFTACMRSNGVADFPGITIDENGQVHLSLSGSSVDPISATYRQAAQTCSHLLPSGSALPQDPAVPKVDTPAMNFSCSGDCPKAPGTPAPPS